MVYLIVSVYTTYFEHYIALNPDPVQAAIAVANSYLDGKPRPQGKHKITARERDAAFWSCGFWYTLPASAWHEESIILALARYFSQERYSNVALLEHIASFAPDSLRRAIRYSGLVLQQHSPRRGEVDRLAEVAPAVFGGFVRILQAFDLAYRQRSTMVELYKQPLAELTPLELLVYASLYAFEYLVPQEFLATRPSRDPDFQTETVWRAINDLLIWKLATTDEHDLRLNNQIIGESLKAHLSPFLFPSDEAPVPRDDLHHAFKELLAAQIELNSFISRSANAFSYDHDIDYVLKDDRLELVVVNPSGRDTWERNGERLSRLHQYWFYRAMECFAASAMATATMGSPENHEANRVAYVKALRTWMRLTEIYGIDETLVTESGLRVGLFQALLSLELMSAFFEVDFLLPYVRNLEKTGDPHAALGLLALEGLLRADFHNRCPITWSDRKAKIARIVDWTVDADNPRGSHRAAEAILDFWTSDWVSLARRLRQAEAGLQPGLIERPVLKLGRYLLQLPWLVAIQNNTTAAINNLRRLGARRAEARSETQRIETRLARCFEERGFRVKLNYQPARSEQEDPGEVDLICARDGQVLVLEIKSTFLRVSRKDAWLHGTNTLRKAGLQLRRKVTAVEKALAEDAELMAVLDIQPTGTLPPLRGWIVDTSIEHDHEYFSGFLKISLEELLIALRDDAHLLNDPGGLFSGATLESDGVDAALNGDHTSTLYADGFMFSSFVAVIEEQHIWRE